MEVTTESIEIVTDLVPSPVPCTVLAPASVAGDADRTDVPMLIGLHGGDGGAHFTDQAVTMVTHAWSSGALAPCVVAVPISGRSFWIDTIDGDARWESFVLDELPECVRETMPACRSGSLNLLGISMGGLGALRMAAKHPERFAAVAALEPGVEAALSWADVDPTATGVRDLTLFERFHGSPVDAAHFDANHPPALIAANHEAMAAAGVEIYVECGDEDMLGLFEGAELVHRLLWDNGVRHEYHLVRGADHVGQTLPARMLEALGFIGRILDPPPPDPQVQFLRELLGPAGG